MLYGFDADENLVIFPGTDEIALDQEQQRELTRQLVKGYCPFCFAPVPEFDKLCRKCLDEIAADWDERYAWRSPSEIALREGILDDYKRFLDPALE